jgi:hypothetical protein
MVVCAGACRRIPARVHQYQPDLFRKNFRFEEVLQYEGIFCFPFCSVRLDFVSVFNESEQVSQFMEQCYEECVWIKIAVDRYPVVLTLECMAIISKDCGSGPGNGEVHSILKQVGLEFFKRSRRHEAG